MGDDGFSREIEAPFNMAIATLQRLDLILQQITQLHTHYTHNSLQKQWAHIDLAKQFYMNSVPLLANIKANEKKLKPKTKKSDKKKEKKIEASPSEKIEKLGKEILNFRMETKTGIRNNVQKVGEIYSYDKEVRLNEIICEIQIRLKNFFMPDKRETEGLI